MPCMLGFRDLNIKGIDTDIRRYLYGHENEVAFDNPYSSILFKTRKQRSINYFYKNQCLVIWNAKAHIILR